MWWNPCSVFCTAGILSSSKSPLCDDFRASRTNCYCGDWVLHVVLPLTSCDFCSQILSVYERHGNKNAATFKKGIFVHPPWAPICMQNLKGGWKFSFPKMFDSYRDLSLSPNANDTTLEKLNLLLNSQHLLTFLILVMGSAGISSYYNCIALT